MDFSAYLESICNNTKYTQWWKTYTVTDVVGKEISKLKNDEIMRSQPFLLDLGLMVQTVPEKDERENREEEKEKIEIFSVLEGLRKYAANHVLLRGKPGSGKSTALIRLLLEESEKRREGDGETRRRGEIPILVELRSYKTSVLDLIQNFAAQNYLFVNNNDLENFLKEGKLLLLVDGVNELPSDAAYRDLQQFEQQYPQTPMIFTTRELGLRGDLKIEKKLTMEPLTEPQMQQFVRGYLPEEQAEEMLKQLGGRIKELGETPLLLWMLCSVFVQNKQEIPDNLGGVFRAFTSIYDQKLKADVTTQSNSRILWSDSLKYLAFEMTKRKNEPAISATEAESILGEFLAEAGENDYSLRRCRLWLQDLFNYHLLQRRGQDEIEFRHQLIQEYYTAETLVLEFDKLTDEQLQWDYLNYLKWTEPMAVVAGLLREEKQAVRMVKLGLAVDLKLGARLAGEVNYTFQGETVDLVKKLDIPVLYKVELLGRTKSEEAISELEKALNHSDSSVRRKAVEALGKIGSDKAVASLETALSHSDSYVHRKVTEALGKIGSDKAFESLQKALNHSDKWVRSSAAQALGNIGLDKAIESLEKALNDSDECVRGKSARALGQIGSNKAIESLEKALNDSDGYVIENASFALGKIASDQAIETLEKALNQSDKWVRRKAAAALGQISSDKVIGSLEKALNDSDKLVHYEVVEALGNTGLDKAIESLEKSLHDSDELVRRKSTEALGRIASNKAVESLEKALNNSYDDVRRKAAEALQQIIIESLEKALNDSDMFILKKAVEALGGIGSDQVSDSLLKVINSLLKALDHSDKDIRCFAASVFREIDLDKISKSLLEKMLNPFRRYITLTPRLKLRKISSDKVIDRLEDVLNDSNPMIRCDAAYALGEIGSDKTIEVLSIFLLKSDWQYYNESFSRILQALEIIQDKSKIYQNFCLPFLKIPQNSFISDTKLTEYCLKYRQHHDKSRQITQAGFSLSNPQQLKQAIQQLITENIVSQHQENDYGILYQVKGELNSINDEKLEMITVWLKRKVDQKIQFISLKIISDYD
ncbi:HEAT repeat domain-containing protein [Crocosphaera sp.]|uniref:HEAT repeat domain-containing protein n=1 Tax=Crocosphaera sp. TaxID=2729996 RepID=UPI00260800AD|nr:HEAT repeat domain-containing protein [Crocosphaera sp.]MDJ0582372.1 HEAT repeat domain-containing protein [Crocosphaera sp.]